MTRSYEERIAEMATSTIARLEQHRLNLISKGTWIVLGTEAGELDGFYDPWGNPELRVTSDSPVWLRSLFWRMVMLDANSGGLKGLSLTSVSLVKWDLMTNTMLVSHHAVDRLYGPGHSTINLTDWTIRRITHVE